MRSKLKRVLKAARDYPAANQRLTDLARHVERTTGRESEWLRTHLPRSGLVELSLPNDETLKLWSRADDWISTQIFWRGFNGYEPETTPVWFRLAQRSRLTVDVGAYVGYMTILAGLANRASKVIAIEPYPPTFGRLSHNVRLNSLRNVECLNLALGEREGFAALYHLPQGYSSAASLAVEHLAEHNDVTSTQVPVRCLDDVMRERGDPPVDLLKVDTETTEPAVLAGALETIDRYRPHIICEVLDHPGVATQLTQMLRPFGYQFYELRLGGVRRHSVVRIPQSRNCLFSVWGAPDIMALAHP